MRLIAATGILAVLAGCGGSGGDSQQDEQTGAAPARGALIENPPQRLLSASAAELTAVLAGTEEGRQLLEFTSPPRCGIDIHQLRYHTVDAQNQPTTASGALMIPTGGDPARAHGRSSSTRTGRPWSAPTTSRTSPTPTTPKAC